MGEGYNLPAFTTMSTMQSMVALPDVCLWSVRFAPESRGWAAQMTGSSCPNSLAGAGALAMLNPQIETSAFRSGGLSSPRPSRDVNDTGMEKA